MSIAIIEIVRPKQWYKNLLVFLPLIASLNLTEINAVIFSLFAFSVLCISSGGWYVVNDLIDYKKDLLHPQKKNRPIPSGRFSKKQAIVLATSLLAISEILSLMINLNFFVVNSTLIALTIFYSVKAKNIFLVDVFLISINFVLRAVAGAYAIDVGISPWLIMGIFFLALLLAFGKRKSETMFLGENAQAHRKVLKSYSKEILSYSIAITSAAIIVSYSIYAMNGPEEIGDWRLVLTIPIAFFILIIYVSRVFVGSYSGKELNDLLVSEKKLIFSILVYVIFTIILIYFIPNTYFN